jgi:hypothetical protein
MSQIQTEQKFKSNGDRSSSQSSQAWQGCEKSYEVSGGPSLLSYRIYCLYQIP